MIRLFEDMPGALDNSAYFSQKINFVLTPKSPSIPRYLNREEASALKKEVKKPGSCVLSDGIEPMLESAGDKPLKDKDIQEDRDKNHAWDLGPRQDEADHGKDTHEQNQFFLEESRLGLQGRLERYILPGIANDLERQEILKVYQDRLEYECQVIIQMGFAGYFLIVSDFIRWAKSNHIPVGPGRGSGAGSLVAWSLLITDVDPIRYQLLFERFLNPERVSMPDFDVDFCQERRDEVIVYVRDKYGSDRVAHIITFGTLQSRGVLRDVGRVLQMPYSQVDRLCKLIPYHPVKSIPLAEAIVLEPLLHQAIEEDERVAKLFEIGQQLEGLYRHASTHAAGIVISDGPLTDRLPLYQDPRSLLPATEFSMKYVELAGLIKFDFLGLKTLTVLAKCVEALGKRGISMDLLDISLDDQKTFQLLRRVETVGVFQLESSGMSSVLRQLQPERFEELIALVALYRPGPMDDIPRYLACRHGREVVHYAYPCLEDILKETFGVMVYQEQVLQIARTLAGYSLGAADLLRRAMAKKIPSEMALQRKIFVDGVLKNYGGQAEKAEQLFEQIAKFAGYAFPKGHATPYALISYQTAYMKANFPVEFMTELLNSDLNNTDSLAFIVEEIKRMGIVLLPPDVNHSHSLFCAQSLQDGTLGIRYGLGALKNVGRQLMEVLEKDRKERGLFESVYDFFERSMGYNMNKRQVESLIMAGAFDGLYGNRKTLLDHIPLLMSHGCASKPSLEAELFAPDSLRPVLVENGSWSNLERLEKEFQAFGFYGKNHPLDCYKETLCHQNITFFSQLRHQGASQYLHKKQFLMCGILIALEEKTTKNKKKLSILKISDPSGVYDVVLFGDDREKFQDLIALGKAYVVTVVVRIDNDQLRLSCSGIELLDQMLDALKVPMVLSLAHKEELENLKALLDQAFEGHTPLVLEFQGVFQGQGWKARGTLGKTYFISFELRCQLYETFLEKKCLEKNGS
jgi:DNA polymerase III subunit alpha